jgi:hypothetical protein
MFDQVYGKSVKHYNTRQLKYESIWEDEFNDVDLTL